jgi:hypothetical protein
MTKLTLYYKNNNDPSIPLFIEGEVTQNFIQMEEHKLLHGLVYNYSIGRQINENEDGKLSEQYNPSYKDIPISVNSKRKGVVQMIFKSYSFNISGFKDQEEASKFALKYIDRDVKQ